MERQELKEVYKVKSLIDSSLASGNMQNRERIDRAVNSYKHYSELALPWLSDGSNMNSKPALTKEYLTGVKNILAERRKKMDEKNKK